MAETFPPSPGNRHISQSIEPSAAPARSFSWWTWRPGLAPIQALFIGLPLLLLASLLFATGLYVLIFGIIDGVSPPIQMSGVAIGYTSSSLDNLPRLTIRLDQPRETKEITTAVSPSTSRAIHVGDGVTLDYSQHLHSLYELGDGGRRYDLPGGSASGNLPGSILLLLIASLLLPYPLFLTFGGWHDLRGGKYSLTGKVVALRSTATNVIRQGGSPRPGVTARIGRAWYGMAMRPLELLEPPFHQQILIFRLNEDLYRDLREGEIVRVVYTPHLHHVQSLKLVDRA